MSKPTRSANLEQMLLARMLDTFFAYGFEKIWRLEQYIKEIKNVSGFPKEVSIIKTLSNGATSIRQELLELVETYLLFYDKNLSIDDSVKLLQDFSAIYKRFPELLNLLGYTYTPWPSAQLYELLKELGDPKTESIALINEYDFWIERDKFPPFYALPKSEKDNPLMWPILGHEIGHNIWLQNDIGNKLDYDNDFKILNEFWYNNSITRRLCKGAGDSSDVLKRWHDEYFADRYATNFVGPCYLPSLLSFSLTLSPNRNIWEGSPYHPPIAHRIASIIDYLESRLNIILNSENDREVREARIIKKYLKVCKDFFHIRLKIHEKSKYVLDVKSDKNDFFIEPNALKILNSVKDMAYLAAEENDKNNERDKTFYLSPYLKTCFERINEGIPIGSVPYEDIERQSDEPDYLIKILDEIQKISSNTKDENEARKQQYRELQGLVYDVPVSIHTIINVGWFYHIRSQATEWRGYMTKAMQGAISWEVAIEWFHSWLQKQDELVSASIDQSKIHATLLDAWVAPTFMNGE